MHISGERTFNIFEALSKLEHLWSCKYIHVFFFFFFLGGGCILWSNLQSQGGMLCSPSVTKDLKELNKTIYRTQNVIYRHHIILHYKELLLISPLNIWISHKLNQHESYPAKQMFLIKKTSEREKKRYRFYHYKSYSLYISPRQDDGLVKNGSKTNANHKRPRSLRCVRTNNPERCAPYVNYMTQWQPNIGTQNKIMYDDQDKMRYCYIK